MPEPARPRLIMPIPASYVPNALTSVDVVVSAPCIKQDSSTTVTIRVRTLGNVEKGSITISESAANVCATSRVGEYKSYKLNIAATELPHDQVFVVEVTIGDGATAVAGSFRRDPP
jgi:hypothetical protein